MLLAPVNNASPPFCNPTHFETLTYNDNEEDMGRTEKPIVVPSVEKSRSNADEVGRNMQPTVSATVSHSHTNETEASKRRRKSMMRRRVKIVSQSWKMIVKTIVARMP